MVEQRDKTRASGPILIVANHPNSFFDAILIGSLFKKPVHFLARGDAFKKSWHRKMLSALNMIPVYRLSEGKENLGLNDFAFRRSKEVLSAKGIVLIFIEGICVHKHELQPFKKGAARIVLENKDLPGFRVLPVGLAYNSFVKFGKKINILFGDFYEARDLVPYEQAPQNFRNFNFQMQEVLTKKIRLPEIKKTNANILLLIPAAAGSIIHRPLYFFLSATIRKKTKGTVFYDSVLFGSLLIVYPLYLLILFAALLFAGLPLISCFTIMALHPITAYCAVKTKAASL